MMTDTLWGVGHETLPSTVLVEPEETAGSGWKEANTVDRVG